MTESTLIYLERSFIMTTPYVLGNDLGALLAEIPGILGYYPTDSLVVLGLVHEEGTRHRIGPVVRCDLDADAVRETATALTALDVDTLLVVLVTPTLTDDHVDLLDLLPDVAAAWHTVEILTDDPVMMVRHDPDLAPNTVAAWQTTTVGPVHEANSTRALLARGGHLSLTREAVVAPYAFAPKLMPAELGEKIAELVEFYSRSLAYAEAAGGLNQETADMISGLRYRIASEPNDDDQPSWPEMITADADLYARARTALSGEYPAARDLLIGEALDYPRAMRPVLKMLARTCISPTERANAFCLLAMIDHDSGPGTDAGLLLQLAREADDSHHLTVLLTESLGLGKITHVIAVVRRGVDATRNDVGLPS